MSYYRYITGLYKSYWPQLNRTLRSSSVPRSVPDITTARAQRASSVPPSAFYSNSFYSHAATPFRDRAASVPPTYTSYRSNPLPPEVPSYSYSHSYTTPHYTDFDCKVVDYMGQLEREEMIRSSVSQSRNTRSDYTYRQYPSDSFASKYSYYDGNKHYTDYLYPTAPELLGSWKHYNLASETVNLRNARATSPLQSMELNRYFDTKKRTNYIGDISSGGATDFRHYNYRRVPYFGGSDCYQYLKNYKPNGKRRL